MTKEKGIFEEGVFISDDKTNARLFEMLVKSEARDAVRAGVPVEDLSMIMTGLIHGVESILNLFTKMLDETETKEELKSYLLCLSEGAKEFRDISLKRGFAKLADTNKAGIKEKLYTAAESKLVH